MLVWLKRFGFVAAVIIIFEILAWITLALLGDNALDKLKSVYLPKEPSKAITRKIGEGGDYEKCSTLDGELFCIREEEVEDNESRKTPSELPPKITGEAPSDSADEIVEKCSTFEGELICIKEKK